MNWLRWWRHRPLWPALGLGCTVLLFALWLVLPVFGVKNSITNKQGNETPIWLFGPAGVATVALYTYRSSRKMWSGDANPGVVIATGPVLIAVPTDLAQGPGRFPAVKIERINLCESGGRPLEVGSRVPTIATYADGAGKDAGHWADFYPVPADYATGDPAEIGRLIDSFPDSQYKFLEAALEEIEKPYQPGLYAMWAAPGKRAGRRITSVRDF
ncbi:MAG: DUF3239 domain-containing protein [Planctomycetota bacterium]